VESDEVDYRQWKDGQRAGEEIGPTCVSLDGFMLARPTGKLILPNLRDWSGDIQNLHLAKPKSGKRTLNSRKLFDLGDLIGSRATRADEYRRADRVFAEGNCSFLTKMVGSCRSEKHRRFDDPNCRATDCGTRSRVQRTA